jgi:hypothetical protein
MSDFASGKLPRFAWISSITILLMCTTATAQGPTYGIKLGVPIMQPFQDTGTPFATYSFSTPRWTVGPSVGWSFSDNLGVEMDALWRRLHYQSGAPSTTATDWEFPILLKGSLSGEALHPFGDMGFAFRYARGKTQLTSTLQRNPPVELINTWSGGLSAGGGLDVSVGSLRFLPEIRYTRWRTSSFSGAGGQFSSNLNQIDLLLGFNLGR